MAIANTAKTFDSFVTIRSLWYILSDLLQQNEQRMEIQD